MKNNTNANKNIIRIEEAKKTTNKNPTTFYEEGKTKANKPRLAKPKPRSESYVRRECPAREAEDPSRNDLWETHLGPTITFCRHGVLEGSFGNALPGIEMITGMAMHGEADGALNPITRAGEWGKEGGKKGVREKKREMKERKGKL